MTIPEPGSAEFDNLVVEQAWAEIEPVLMEVAQTRIRNHNLPGFVKPTWAMMKKQPAEEAVQTIARMIVSPWFQRQGLEMARKMIEELEANAEVDNAQ